MASTSETPSLNEQCLSIVAAMNAMTPGINQVLFIREIMPPDELIDDALHFKTERRSKDDGNKLKNAIFGH